VRWRNSGFTSRAVCRDSQSYGSDDEHMVSRVFLSIALDGQPRGDFYADLKQTVGDNYETGAIEVGPPTMESGETYSGPMSHGCFSEGAVRYFRSLVGSVGSGIRIGGGGNIRMHDNLFELSFDWECDVDDGLGSR
jgi:hypothetical protein